MGFAPIASSVGASSWREPSSRAARFFVRLRRPTTAPTHSSSTAPRRARARPAGEHARGDRPGTISNRTSGDAGEQGTGPARTASTGAIPSVAPAKTSTGAVIADSEWSRSPSSNRPGASTLLREAVVELPEAPARVGGHVGGEPVDRLDLGQEVGVVEMGRDARAAWSPASGSTRAGRPTSPAASGRRPSAGRPASAPGHRRG